MCAWWAYLLCLCFMWGPRALAFRWLLGRSPFSSHSTGMDLAFLQVFLGITAVTVMILAAVIEERRELERRKDEFISMASHELKTPLTSLRSYAELLQSACAQQYGSETLRLLSKMARQIERLAGLIADLFDLSKMQAILSLDRANPGSPHANNG